MLTFHILNVYVDKTQPRQFKFTFNPALSVSLLHESFHLVFCLPLCVFPGTVASNTLPPLPFREMTVIELVCVRMSRDFRAQSVNIEAVASQT